MSAVPRDLASSLVPGTNDSSLPGATDALASDRKARHTTIRYWAAWVALGAWAVRCDSYYLMNGWWMVLVVFWFTAKDRPYPVGRWRFLSLAVVTIAATFLIYGTFEWLQEIADGWSWGPRGQWLRIVALPMRALVAAIFTAAVLVPQLRRHMQPYSGTLLILAALPVGLAEYGSAIGSTVHWREHWLANCIELFSIIILPLILAAIDGRMGAIRWPSGRLVMDLRDLWRGETPIWVALMIVYPMTIIGVIWLIKGIGDLDRHGHSDWEYANLYAIGWVLLILLLIIGSLVTFRSLNRSVEKGRAIARSTQGAIILIAAPFLLYMIAGEGFSVGHTLTESAKAALGSAYDLQVPDHGAELRLSGEVAYGLADRLKEELDSHPGVSRIRLESDGGDVNEASRAAKLIAAHKLDTVVGNKCVSACTIMFVAGKDRTLEKGAGLGFHAAKSQDPTEGAAGSFRAAFIPYGIDNGFIA